MVDIIPTIKDTIQDCKIQYLRKCGISKYRFNFSKVYSEDGYEKFLSAVFRLRRINPDSVVVLDVPYPVEKCRIYGGFNTLNITKGYRYYLMGLDDEDAAVKSDIMYIKSDFKDEIATSDTIIYDSGEGSFHFSKMIGDNCIEVIADNNFIVENTKALSTKHITKKEYYNKLDYLCNYIKPDEVALSFIEDKNDLTEAIELKKKYNFKIVSKIETERAMTNIEKYANIRI